MKHLMIILIVWNYVEFVAAPLLLVSSSLSMTLDDFTAGRVSVLVAV